MPASRPPFKRLYENITKTDDGCWLWNGQTTKQGYGQIKAFTKIVSVHRLSYELYYGPVPEGKEVCHSCDVRNCINPNHLSAGTHQSNMDDMKKRGKPRTGNYNPRIGILSTQAKPVMVLGKKYGSMKEAERSLNVGSGTVRYWILNRSDKAKYITRKEYENG